jgi:hypothetical protein
MANGIITGSAVTPKITGKAQARTLSPVKRRQKNTKNTAAVVLQQ